LLIILFYVCVRFWLNFEKGLEFRFLLGFDNGKHVALQDVVGLLLSRAVNSHCILEPF
jgi:hypothetical protein